MADIELPRDAEGREIPLDTKVLYGEVGKEFDVNYYEYSVRQTIQRCKWQAVVCVLHTLQPMRMRWATGPSL